MQVIRRFRISYTTPFITLNNAQKSNGATTVQRHIYPRVRKDHWSMFSRSVMLILVKRDNLVAWKRLLYLGCVGEAHQKQSNPCHLPGCSFYFRDRSQSALVNVQFFSYPQLNDVNQWALLKGMRSHKSSVWYRMIRKNMSAYWV